MHHLLLKESSLTNQILGVRNHGDLTEELGRNKDMRIEVIVEEIIKLEITIKDKEKMKVIMLQHHLNNRVPWSKQLQLTCNPSRISGEDKVGKLINPQLQLQPDGDSQLRVISGDNQLLNNLQETLGASHPRKTIGVNQPQPFSNSHIRIRGVNLLITQTHGVITD